MTSTMQQSLATLYEQLSIQTNCDEKIVLMRSFDDVVKSCIDVVGCLTEARLKHTNRDEEIAIMTQENHALRELNRLLEIENDSLKDTLKLRSERITSWVQKFIRLKEYSDERDVMSDKLVLQVKTLLENNSQSSEKTIDTL